MRVRVKIAHRRLCELRSRPRSATKPRCDSSPVLLKNFNGIPNELCFRRQRNPACCRQPANIMKMWSASSATRPGQLGQPPAGVAGADGAHPGNSPREAATRFPWRDLHGPVPGAARRRANTRTAPRASRSQALSALVPCTISNAWRNGPGRPRLTWRRPTNAGCTWARMEWSGPWRSCSGPALG